MISAIVLAAILSLQAGTFSVRGETEKKEEKDLNLYAQSAVLMDAVSGRILYGKNAQIQRPMASTTKIMTGILALELGNLEDVVTVSSEAAGQPKVHLGMRKGETFLLKDLLYSLMLESHNDSAVAIAEHIGGSVEGFAVLMNQKARDLGCVNTYFVTPNGLDATVTAEDGSEQIHSTTASDLARIMRYCVLESPQKDAFMEITRTQNHYFSDLEGKRSFNCANHNAFLTMMNGVLSGKTGFTGGAGYSYILALENEGRTFIVALLGCGWPPHKTYKWSDTRKLLDYGMENYRYEDVFEEPNLGSVPVRNGIVTRSAAGGVSSTQISMNLSDEEKVLQILKQEKEQVTIQYDIPKELMAPVRAGMTVGTVTYRLEGDIVKRYPIFACDTIEKINYLWCFQNIWNRFLLSEKPDKKTAGIALQY